MEPARAVGAPNTSDTVLDQSVFEGMFVRALKLDPPFIEALTGIGYDPRNPKGKYPGSVWRAAQKVACQRLYPNLPEEKALFELGKLFIEGFHGTIVGKVIQAMLPFLKADTLVKRIPKFVTMTAQGIEVTVRDGDRPGVWIGTWKDPNAAPEFVEGLMSGGLARSKLSGVRLLSKGRGTYELEFRASA